MTPWKGPVNWAALSHPQLYHAATADSEPAIAYERGRDWAALGADMIDQAQVLAARIAATGSGWRGAAGDSVRAATLALTDWCDDAGASALAVAECVAEQAAAVAEARVRMPEPVGFDWDTALGSFAGVGHPAAMLSDLRELGERARTAVERAVEVMTELERWSARIDEAIPSCPTPPGPVGPGRAETSTGGATLPGAGAPPAVLPRGGDERTAPAGVTGGPVGVVEPTLAGFGGTGGADGRVPAGPAVLSPGLPVGAPPIAGRPAEIPAQDAPVAGRGQPGGIGGPGVPGAPGTGTGPGRYDEHRTPRYLTGERLFDPLPAVGSVIGDTWRAEWAAGTEQAGDRGGRQ